MSIRGKDGLAGGTGGSRAFSAGKEKAITRVSQTYDSNTKGLGLTKGSNKSYAKANPTVKKAGKTLNKEAAAKAKSNTPKVPVKRTK
jgi:hypothetical protein